MDRPLVRTESRRSPKEPLLDLGGEGWDTMGTATKKGDSWFTSMQGQIVVLPPVVR